MVARRKMLQNLAVFAKGDHLLQDSSVISIDAEDLQQPGILVQDRLE